MSDLTPSNSTKIVTFDNIKKEKSSESNNQKEEIKLQKSNINKKTQNKKNKIKKCFCCGKSKRVILLKCRCEKIFCSSHLLPEKHQCEFDYIEYSKKLLEKRNPKIICEKVPTI